MSGRFIIMASLLALGGTLGSGEGWRPIHPLGGIAFRSDFELTYDDNLFKYSPEDIDKFVNNEEPHRFPIESYDDLTTSLRLSAKARRRLIPGRLTTFNVHIKHHQYTVNPLKSYQVFSLNMWQKLTRRSHLQLGYLLLPSYLVRHYPDWDIPYQNGHPVYVECRFREHLFSFELGGRIPGDVSVSASYKREIDDYNGHFEEYDSKADRLGIEATYKLKETLPLTLGYRFKSARAKGYDEEGEDKKRSDDCDISYDEDVFLIETGLDLERIKTPLSLRLGYSFERRCFTSEKSLWEDPFHAGREDRGHNFSADLKYQLNPRFSWSLGYSHRMRDVHSPYPGEIDEVKDFRENRFSTGVSLSH